MWILLILAVARIGGVAIPATAEFENKKACEQAAAWYNQRPNVNAFCVEDKTHGYNAD